MKIRKGDLLIQLSAISGKTQNQVSYIVVSELLNNNIIDDIHENYGCPVFDVINEEVSTKQIDNCIEKISFMLGVPAKQVHGFIMDLELIGDYDCPVCGGMLDILDGEYISVGGDGYIIPAEYMPLWEEKKCHDCGYITR